jgi:hypothetical protein
MRCFSAQARSPRVFLGSGAGTTIASPPICVEPSASFTCSRMPSRNHTSTSVSRLIYPHDSLGPQCRPLFPHCIAAAMAGARRHRIRRRASCGPLRALLEVRFWPRLREAPFRGVVPAPHRQIEAGGSGRQDGSTIARRAQQQLRVREVSAIHAVGSRFRLRRCARRRAR